MNKSLAFDFLGLYRAILLDVAVYFPDDQVEWDRDLLRLTRLYRTRGQPVFTIDLPSVGKALDMSLSTGRLVLDGLNHVGSRNPGSKIPRLFWGLWSRLFDEGCLKADVDPNVVLFLRTLLYVGKNLKWECSPRYLYETTKEFFDIEAQIPAPSPIWDGNGVDLRECARGHINDLVHAFRAEPDMLNPERSGSDELMLNSVQISCDRVVGLLGVFDPSSWRFKHGPGSVSDLPSGGYKYDFPSWSLRLEAFFPYDMYGLTGMSMMEKLGSDGIEHNSDEACSKLIAVPKSQKGPRLIASEPTCHQWAQQCIKDFLYARVQSTILGRSIHFKDQTYNQEMALSGSKSRAYSTIDLKSASDRLSCHVVQKAFRGNLTLLGPMIASRTRYLRNTVDKKLPKLHKLRKFSTQGSALTFPIQSLVFLAIVLGVGKHLEPNRTWAQLGEDVCVFGDDIIVPTTWEAAVSRALALLGLVVNRTKTYTEGNFRESCGMDGWSGYDVTPPHVLLPPASPDPDAIASTVAVSNNFYLKGFWNAANWLSDHLSKRNILTVGSGSGVFGFKSFTGAPIPSFVGWDKDLHCHYTLGLTVLAKSRRVKQDTFQSTLQYFTEEPEPYVKYESGVAVAGATVLRRARVPVELLD